MWEEAAEKARREFEELRAPYERAEREKARLKAEQEAKAARQRADLFVAKGTLPFSEPLAIEICERVSSGELLINIAFDEHMPTVRRVTQWLRESPNSPRSTRTRSTTGWRSSRRKSSRSRMTPHAISGTLCATGDRRESSMAMQSHGRSCASKCASSTLKPTSRPSGASNRHLNVKQSDPLDLDQMTTEELAAKIAELEHKDRVVNEDRRSVAA